MRFLSLSGLQAALLALVTAGAIIALYFLKVRHRRVVVASSLLWGRVLDELHQQSLWEKLRRIVSIVLAVLIGLLIAMAVARPEVPWLTGGGERALLVLDSSPTMNARTADGQTRWRHAVDAAMRLVNSSAPSSEFRVADTAGRVDAAFTSDRREIREALQRMRPLPASSRFPDVDPDTTKVLFFTDNVIPPPAPRGTARRSFFEEAENAGITAFEIRTTPSSSQAYEAWLEVHNYGVKARKATLTVSGSGAEKVERSLDLPAGGAFRESFDLSRFSGGPIQASLDSEGDALADDDEAYAYLPVKRKTKTLLVTAGNPYLETLLQLHSLVDLTTIKAPQFRPDPTFDVYILDGFVPLNPPPRPSLLLNPPAASWLPPTKGSMTRPRFGTWSEDHPVMRYVSLHDVLVEKAARLDGAGLTVLAEAEDRSPLVLASDEPGRPRWLLLPFSLQTSDFPLHPGFPLFVDNALAWLGREPLALRRQPGLVSAPFPKAEIKKLDGTAVPSYTQAGSTVFSAEPGLYVANTEAGTRRIAVSLASAQYSNVNAMGSSENARAVVNAGWLQEELWVYMLAAAALLIAAEWFTYHRGITL
jgi:hypothetical protein